MSVYLDVDDLHDVAEIVLNGTPVVREYGLVSSAAIRPATEAFGVEVYVGVWAKAAALLHSICMNHALIDGNKRLAWSAARVFLGLNGVPPVDVDVDEAEALVMAVAAGSVGDVAAIADGLRRLYPAVDGSR
jgi:death-on-curing protein